MAHKKKDMPDSIQFLATKSGVSLITIAIGLYCGINDSHTSFYIASLVQAINNVYDSFSYLSGYNPYITFFHLASFLSAIFVCIISIIHFSSGYFTGIKTEIAVVVCLCIPVIHFLSEIVIKFFQGRY